MSQECFSVALSNIHMPQDPDCKEPGSIEQRWWFDLVCFDLLGLIAFALQLD